ncbi:hypothetical protein B0H11DRAFT_2040003 [Mycena galericulata]|nr:hypothetical protein B0H11DRAFT_2040003 [Mycena galericulata]
MAPASACPSCGFSTLEGATLPLSPHPEFLISGIPSESQAAAIQAAVDSSEHNILAIEAEMQRLGQALNELSARRRELREFCVKHRPALSPLRKLPSELFAEIFFWCQEKQFSGELRSDSRWILTRVCRTWRAVVTSTPSLWAKIELSPRSQSYSSDKSLIYLLSLQIKWSREYPLTLRYHPSDGFSPALRHFVMTLLLSVAYRWQDASLGLTYGDLQLLSNFSGYFPLLKRLQLSRAAFEGAFEISTGSTFLDDCPLLQRLHVPLCPSPTLIKFPWAQLETCVFPIFTAPDVLRVLRLTPNIVGISLGSQHDADAGLSLDAQTSGTTSPTLKILHMSSYNSHSARMLRGLVAPALRRLAIERGRPSFTWADPQEPNPSVHASIDVSLFLTRSRCSLTHLSLRHIPVPRDTLLELLALTPDLTHLLVHNISLGSCRISEPLIRALTCVPGAQRQVVPRMVSLSLSGVFACASYLVVEMLRSRSAATGAGELRVARLFTIYGSPKIPFVDRVRAEGLDVTCCDAEEMSAEMSTDDLIGWSTW